MQELRGAPQKAGGEGRPGIGDQPGTTERGPRPRDPDQRTKAKGPPDRATSPSSLMVHIDSACAAGAQARSGTSRSSTGLCKTCGETWPWSCFSKGNRYQEHPTCDSCSSVALQTRSPISLGPCDRPCQYCGTLLFAFETSSFCCSSGANHVDFAQYFKPPSAKLLDIFARTWPLLNNGGLPPTPRGRWAFHP